MAMGLKVSIVIPHLPGTREEFLKIALEHIDKQPYKNYEVILVSQNKSEIDNIKDGIAKAKGDIIHIHHDDDWFTPNALKLAVDHMLRYDFIHGNAHEIGGADYVPANKYPKLIDLIDHNHIHNATLFYRADVFDKVEYEQDWLFLLRCLERGLKIGYCPYFLKNYRLHAGSLSNTEHWKNIIRPNLNKIVYERYKQFFKEAI